MYVMFVEGELKPGNKVEFEKAWRHQILPLLQKQGGFVDEILLFEEGSLQPRGLSFWETREQCERYRREVFPQAKKHVEHLLRGEPRVRGFHVGASERFEIKRREAA